MPELDFMKSRNEKQMSDEEFKRRSEELNAKAVESGDTVKKIIYASLAVFALSFVIIFLLTLFNSEKNYGAGIGNYNFMLVEFVIIALFLYDVKAENEKKYRYETDRKVLLKAIENAVKFNRMKLIFVIFFVLIFVIMNVAAWVMVASNLSNSSESDVFLPYLRQIFML